MDKNTDAILLAARTAHEVNRAYCIGLGDFSQAAWDDAPQWQRDSALVGVCAIRRNPETSPRQSHEGWLSQKKADGWVYGETKDPRKKTHPCMVPYDDLSEKQKCKDILFSATIRGILGQQNGEQK